MTQIKSFYFDNEPFLLPVGTKKIHDSGNWAIYYNELEDFTLIVTRGRFNGKLGWRVRYVMGQMRLSNAEHYVKTSCGGCLKYEY